MQAFFTVSGDVGRLIVKADSEFRGQLMRLSGPNRFYWLVSGTQNARPIKFRTFSAKPILIGFTLMYCPVVKYIVIFIAACNKKPGHLGPV
ncbi:MAG: hypothetical protein SFU87_19465, partial [Chitinophagaceae bacterium]|nr:hypothetical protein [Chitinophagaceae bacterium]